MMRLLDSARLAGAKLQTHRIRTGIVVFVAALLFAGIITVLLLATGAAKSMQAFGKEGLGGRYIVRGQPIIDTQVLYRGSPKMIEALKQQAESLKVEKKAAAKKLGIAYDPATDTTLPVMESKNPDGSTSYFLDSNSVLAQKAIKDEINALQHISFTDFNLLAKQYGATKMYQGTTQSMMSGPRTYTGSLNLIIDGTERSSDQKASGMPKGIDSLTALGWSYLDAELLKPFVLPRQNLAVNKDGAIPVIAPVSAAEQMLNLASLPATASTQQRLDRLVKVRSDIAGKVSQFCYRNDASNSLVTQAKQQAQEMQKNKGKSGYVAPSVQYAAPATVCGATTISKDTRSAEEKKAAANEIEFKRTYENYVDPEQSVVQMRVVGVVPDLNFESGFSARSILELLLRSNLGQGWFSPIGAVSPGSVADKISPALESTSYANQQYFAEFASLDDAKKFAEAASCTSQGISVKTGGQVQDAQDPRVAACYKDGKYFDSTPFGNNASAMEDLRRIVWKVMTYVAPVVLIISALVLMGIIGKIIADSRRETAVFRALGATRFTIAQIYLTYSLFIAAGVILVAFVIGSVAAMLISNKLTPEASVSAVLAYNANDVHQQFTFFGFDLVYAAVVIGLIFTAALLSTVLPLLTNIRRNPISDMRDEN